MENLIIIGILAAVVALAVLRAVKHFKGGCCGSGSSVVRSRKTLTDPVLYQRRLTVEGMHCENCQARVENGLNRLESVACLVDLKKKTATVSCSVQVSDEQLKQTVEKLGYQVTQIR